MQYRGVANELPFIFHVNCIKVENMTKLPFNPGKPFSPFPTNLRLKRLLDRKMFSLLLAPALVTPFVVLHWRSVEIKQRQQKHCNSELSVKFPSIVNWKACNRKKCQRWLLKREFLLLFNSISSRFGHCTMPDRCMQGTYSFVCRSVTGKCAVLERRYPAALLLGLETRCSFVCLVGKTETVSREEKGTKEIAINNSEWSGDREGKKRVKQLHYMHGGAEITLKNS